MDQLSGGTADLKRPESTPGMKLRFVDEVRGAMGEGPSRPFSAGLKLI